MSLLTLSILLLAAGVFLKGLAAFIELFRPRH